MKNIVSAYIEVCGKFLIAKRNTPGQYNGLWEFPCTEVDKCLDDCGSMDRFAKERLHIDIRTKSLLASDTFCRVKTDQEIALDADEEKKYRTVFKKLYDCEYKGGDLSTNVLSGYSEAKFIDGSQAGDYNWYPADYSMLAQISQQGVVRTRKPEKNNK